MRVPFSALTKKVSNLLEVNMIIVALEPIEKRIEMRLVHRHFRDYHVPNAEKEYPCSYSIEMGEAIVSVRETTHVDLEDREIENIEGLDEAWMFIQSINLWGNHIVTIEGLNKCKNLVKLYLGWN